MRPSPGTLPNGVSPIGETLRSAG